MGILQVVGMARALVLFSGIPISVLVFKPEQMHTGLYSRTDWIPTQQSFSGLVSFDPGVRYERQLIMSYITFVQSECDGPGAGAATGEGEFALLRAWMGATSDDSNNSNTERRRDCFIIAIPFL